jgi:pimeloyl-ACP methyl ester carboxylesterase
MPFVETNGSNLYYEVHGHGPAVVLAHPGGGNHLSWWQQVPAFARRYTCITFDHRGHGATRDVENDPGAAAYGQDLIGLLDHLGIEKTAIVGQSMGGVDRRQYHARSSEPCEHSRAGKLNWWDSRSRT